MKYLLLIPFFTFAQLPDSWKKYDDAIDFWSTFAVNDISYHTLGLTKMKANNRILVASGMTAAYCFVSEKIEYKTWLPRNGRGMDMLTKLWSIPVYMIVRTCLNDFKKRRQWSFENRKLLLD